MGRPKMTTVVCCVCGIPGGVVGFRDQSIIVSNDKLREAMVCTQCHSTLIAEYTQPQDRRKMPVFKRFKVLKARHTLTGPDR
jgi:hypothetical protein